MVPDAIVAEPNTVQLVMVLLVASACKRIVLVPDVEATVVFTMVRLLLPTFNPFMVTLSAPFKSMNGEPAAMVALNVRATPPIGAIHIDV
ncbi:MAG: hypothetical protein ACOYKE_10615 [Ferruginibacter sp.]